MALIWITDELTWLSAVPFWIYLWAVVGLWLIHIFRVVLVCNNIALVIFYLEGDYFTQWSLLYVTLNFWRFILTKVIDNWWANFARLCVSKFFYRYASWLLIFSRLTLSDFHNLIKKNPLGEALFDVKYQIFSIDTQQRFLLWSQVLCIYLGSIILLIFARAYI